jgi:hypothetical protein
MSKPIYVTQSVRAVLARQGVVGVAICWLFTEPVTNQAFMGGVLLAVLLYDMATTALEIEKRMEEKDDSQPD